MFGGRNKAQSFWTKKSCALFGRLKYPLRLSLCIGRNRGKQYNSETFSAGIVGLGSSFYFVNGKQVTIAPVTQAL
jgi:hypothetical protein